MLIGAAAIALGLTSVALVYLLAVPLALLFAAIAIGEALAPVVDRLEKGMPRTLAVLIVYAAFVATLIAAGWFAWPRIIGQAEQFVAEAPDLAERLPRILREWDPTEDHRLVEAAQQALDQFTGIIVAIPMALISSTVTVGLVIVLSAYWLITAPALGRFTRSLVPPSHSAQFEDVTGELRSSVGGFVRGEVIMAIIVGVLTYAGLTIIGVEYAAVLALVAAIGELIPVVGPILASIPAIIIALFDSPTQALIVAGFYIVLQQVESNVLLPQVMRHTAHVPPLLSVVALFAGAELGGLLGAIVAIPLSGAAKVVAVSVLAPAIRRRTQQHDPGDAHTGGVGGAEQIRPKAASESQVASET
jgi:putative heme transporter